MLSGHEGPISGLCFNPTKSVLASASWDRTVRLWDMADSWRTTETLALTSDGEQPDGLAGGGLVPEPTAGAWPGSRRTSWPRRRLPVAAALVGPSRDPAARGWRCLCCSLLPALPPASLLLFCL